VIDLLDYDGLCLTDHDRWWVNTGDQPPGAADGEQPDWWRRCRPAARAATEADGSEPPADSRFPTGNRALPDDGVLSQDVLPGDQCVCGGLLPGHRRGTVEVQLKLTTLIRRDDDPGLVGGFGSVHAEIARLVALDPSAKPTWRWSVFGDDGELLHHGLTLHRPEAAIVDSRFATGTDGSAGLVADERRCRCVRFEPGERRDTVELQLTPRTLAELLADSDLAPGYERVVADIARQVADDKDANPPGKWAQTDDQGRLLDHGHTGRLPNAVEDAFVRARDRSCRTPGCRRRASRCEMDHRIEHAKGGPSHRGCVDCRCKRHHHMRHHDGFHVNKIGSTTIWTIPSGRSFAVPDNDIVLTRELSQDHGSAAGVDFPA
jgi:hypothetical protein